MQCNFIKRGIFCSNSACFTVSFPSKPVRFCYSYDVSNTSILILELKNPGLNISLKKIKSVISQKLISPSDIEQMILYVGSVFEKQEDMCSNRWAILILSKHSKASKDLKQSPKIIDNLIDFKVPNNRRIWWLYQSFEK